MPSSFEYDNFTNLVTYLHKTLKFEEFNLHICKFLSWKIE